MYFGPSASDLRSRHEDERQLTASVWSLCLLRPDGMGTVSVEEKENFEAIRSRLMALLENQITHFRYEHLRVALWEPVGFISVRCGNSNTSVTVLVLLLQYLTSAQIIRIISLQRRRACLHVQQFHHRRVLIRSHVNKWKHLIQLSHYFQRHHHLKLSSSLSVKQKRSAKCCDEVNVSASDFSNTKDHLIVRVIFGDYGWNWGRMTG